MPSPSDYPKRFDPAKKYQQVLAHPHEYHLHSYDINDIQHLFQHRLKGISDAILADGDIVRGGEIFIDPETGESQVKAAAIYAGGIVHEVVEAEFTIPDEIVDYIGICVTTSVVTHVQDPQLKGTIAGTRAYGEPGAARLKIEARWALESEDDCEGVFYRVYEIEDRRCRPRNPPPVVSPINDALARYDREAHGHYVVKGARVRALGYDSETQSQVFSIDEGVVNVWGYKHDIEYAIRLSREEDPDLLLVEAEPHLAPGTIPPEGLQVFLNHGPALQILGITVVKTVTETITHGAYSGAPDPLGHDSVAEIVSVVQGVTAYTATTDFILAGDQVDWSPAGAEPAPGSSYDVTYRYLDTLAPEELVAFDTTSVTIADDNLTPSSTIIIEYRWALPRVDAICMDRNARIVYIKGESQRYNPWPPRVPNDVLLMAEVHNRWLETPEIKNTKTHSIHYNELTLFGELIYDLFDLVAQERLKRDAEASDVAAKRGLFVDPFLDDDMRDQGIVQTAAIVNQTLKLPINGGPEGRLMQELPYMLPYVQEVVLAQDLVTACLKINPYAVFEPLPGTLTLSPAIDFWVEQETEWASPVTRLFDLGTQTINDGSGGATGSLLAFQETVQSLAEVERRRREAQFLREIEVDFTIRGFGAGEVLQSLTFDNIDITPA